MASMVVIVLPAAAEIGVMQERVATPSRCTVHAPQSAMPHPNFVPVRPSSSRSVHKIGVSDGTSTVTDLPLTFRVGMASRNGVLNPCSQWASVFGQAVTASLHQAGLELRMKCG